MQWSGEPNTGFCPPDRAPWLPIPPNHEAEVNVAALQAEPNSLWCLYQRQFHVCNASPALQTGTYAPLAPRSRSCLAFLRHDEFSGQRVVVAINMTGRARVLILGLGNCPARPLFGSLPERDARATLDRLALAPFEIVVV